MAKQGNSAIKTTLHCINTAFVASATATSSTAASEATSGQQQQQQQQQQTIHRAPGGEQTLCEMSQCHEVCPQGVFVTLMLQKVK